MTGLPTGCGCGMCAAAQKQLNLQGDPCPCLNCADALRILTEHSNPRREEPDVNVRPEDYPCAYDCGRNTAVCMRTPCTERLARLAGVHETEPGGGSMTCTYCGRPADECDAQRCARRIAKDKDPIPTPTPNLPEPVYIEPQVLIQPCPLYVTLTARSGVTVIDARVLAWRIAGERTELLVAGVARPEWIDCTVWEKVRFADERTGLAVDRRVGGPA